MQRKRIRGVVYGVLLSGLVCSPVAVRAQDGYPPDYKPSKPAEKGDTNVLTRALAISDYMTQKLNAAGGQNSPLCYRNCLTVHLNDVLKCIETKTTYAASESCERDGARKMAACDPKCQ
ncbi:MAG: hypothetical protein NZ578_03855 [Candidatus Binatia bacterium]|nr:hypothetical protein [Candidatus Binatia bacterium]